MISNGIDIVKIDRFKDLYNDNDIIANYVKSLDLDTIFVIGDNRNYIYAFLNMYGLKANIMNVDEKYLPYLLNSSFPNSIVIDTSGFNTELLQKLGRRQKLEQRIIDLKDRDSFKRNKEELSREDSCFRQLRFNN